MTNDGTHPNGTLAAQAGAAVSAVMEPIWIECLHNLHCPQCNRRLVQRAGRHFHSRLQRCVYVGEVSSLACPLGHRLPERHELYAYRAARGDAWTAPVSEVVPPGR